MSTSNVSTTSPGTTPFNVDVTACNLLTDLTVKDFQVFIGGSLSCQGASCSNWTKTTSTQLTYSGTAISIGESIQIRRKTPNNVIQTVNFADRVSSSLWNNELDRVIRWREEADLNGVGSGSTTAVALPIDTAYPTGWDNDVISPPTRNAVYDALQLFAPLASPTFTGTPTAPTAADGTNTTQLATTAFAAIRVSNALASSPSLGGNPTATNQSVGNDSTRIANTAFVQDTVDDLLQNQLFRQNFKNLLFNGDFSVWQRATSFTITGSGGLAAQHTADMWRLITTSDGGTSANFTVDRTAFSAGQTEVAFNPSYYLRITNTTQGTSLGNASFHTLTHAIEDVNNLAGETITVSFYARSSIAGKKLGYNFLQFFGSGGSPSALVNGIGGGTVTLTSSWVKYTATINVPSISGKTIGTDGVHTSYVRFQFYLQAGSTEANSNLGGASAFGWQGTGTIDISDIQVEYGNRATTFDRRPLALNLLLCKRYYQKSAPTGEATSSAGNGGIITVRSGVITTNNIGTTVHFLINMRVTPAIKLYDEVGNSGKCYKGGSNKNVTLVFSNSTAITVQSNDATNTDDFRFHFEAEADLI